MHTWEHTPWAQVWTQTDMDADTNAKRYLGYLDFVLAFRSYRVQRYRTKTAILMDFVKPECEMEPE